jgi:hypothetical protein
MAGLDDLLSGGLGGTDLSVDPKEAQSLALIKAMQNSQAAGLQRTATPLGAIAQNLIPLFQAPIEARRLEREGMLKELLLKVQLAKLASATGEDEPKTLEQLAVRKLPKDASLDQVAKAKRDLSAPPAPSEINLLLGKLKGDPEASAAYDAIQANKGVLSPAAVAQQKEIAGVKAAETLGGQKELARYKAEDLPPKMTQRQQDALEAGHTLIGMLDEIPKMVESLPKDIDRSSLARQASKYQIRSEHPIATNLLTGLTGGAVSADTDPRLDPYFATVGQSQAALATFNLAGMRGGYNTLKWLNVHFPGWADDPATVERKAKFLSSNKGIVQKKIQYLQDRLTKSAQAATDMGGEPVGDQVRLKVRGPNGQESYMLFDPETGQSSVADDQGEAP